MAAHPFRFSCLNISLSLSHPSPFNSSGLDCCWICWLCLQNILNLSTLLSSQPLHPPPSNLEEKFKLPTPGQRLCPLLRSHNILSLEQAFVLALCFPVFHLRAFALISPSSWNDSLHGWLLRFKTGLKCHFFRLVVPGHLSLHHKQPLSITLPCCFL